MDEIFFKEAAYSIAFMTPLERTDFVCDVMEECNLHPWEVLSSLGVDDEAIARLEKKTEAFFEDKMFLYERLRHIPTEEISIYVNRFFKENP